MLSMPNSAALRLPGIHSSCRLYMRLSDYMWGAGTTLVQRCIRPSTSCKALSPAAGASTRPAPRQLPGAPESSLRQRAHAGAATGSATSGRLPSRWHRPRLCCMASAATRAGAAAEQEDDAAAKPLLPLVLVVAVVLLDRQGRVLLAQRPPGKKLAGLWEFPGGKVDAGETPEAALARELQEELGIRVAPAALRPLCFASHAYDTFHLLMPTYECTQWEGEPAGQERQALAWVSADELQGGRYAMPPADEPLLPPVLAAMRAAAAAAAAGAAATP